jgi:riboflavin kinase/FMN adenylyltransferase
MLIWRGEEARRVRLTSRPVLALGFFDGVHRGHQALVRRALADARREGRPAGVLTFEPHPLSVLRPERRVDRLTTPDEKEERLVALAPDLVVVYPFGRALADLRPEAFVREILAGQLGVAEVVVGYNFAFGAAGAGRYGLLRRLGQTLDFRAVMIPPILARREVVSATTIRGRLLRGQVAEAERMLGYPYFVRGRVIRGAGRGRSLGFPTANLELPAGKLVPGDGVYLAGAVLPGEAEERACLVAIGRALTFTEGRHRLEAHLLAYDGDLYEKRLQVNFHCRLRGMKRFSTPEALQEQVGEDRQRAEALWPILYSQ